MAKLDWLVAKPIAHRGLHRAAEGIIENTASAVRAAIEAGFAIEVDVQLTADGEAVVFHDEELDRLTTGFGALAEKTAAELAAIPFKSTQDRIWTFRELLELVAGRTTLVVEIKSLWNHDDRLTRRALELSRGYQGPLAFKSFDPFVVATLRRLAPSAIRGIVGDAYKAQGYWSFLPARDRFVNRHLLHWPSTRPHFISWHVGDLPSLATSLARRLAGVPIMTWTVRTPADQARAGLYADQMVFEGFTP